MSKNFHELIDQQQYQSIISGDHVSIAVKNKDPVSIIWKASLMMSGNYLPGYLDVSGSISRRVFAFQFRNLILAEDRNTNMKELILEQELHSIFIRCIKMYRDACDKFRGQDF